MARQIGTIRYDEASDGFALYVGDRGPTLCSNVAEAVAAFRELYPPTAHVRLRTPTPAQRERGVWWLVTADRVR